LKNKKIKICLNCGHPVSYMYGDWCDVILYKPEDPGNHILEDNDEYPLLCCDGNCVYPEDDKKTQASMFPSPPG